MPTTVATATLARPSSDSYDSPLGQEERAFMAHLKHFNADKGKSLNRIPIFDRLPLNLFALFHAVMARGGLQNVIDRKLWRYVASDLQVDPDRSDAGFRLRLHYSKYLFDFEVAALAAENHLIDGYGDPTTVELARLASMMPDERHSKVAASVAAAKANASLFAGAELLEEQHVSDGSRMMSQHQLLMPVEAEYDDIPKLLPAILAPLPLKEFSASTVSPLDASPRAPFSFKALHAGTSVPGIAPAVGAAGPATAAAVAKTLLPPVSAIAFDRDSGSGSGSSSKRKFATAATASASLANIATVVERRQSRKKRAVAVDSDDDEDEDDLRKRKLPDYMTLQKALNGAGVGRVRASTAAVATKVINVGAADEDDDELSTISAFLERLRGEFL